MFKVCLTIILLCEEKGFLGLLSLGKPYFQRQGAYSEPSKTFAKIVNPSCPDPGQSQKINSN